MDTNLNNDKPLPYVHISEANKEILEYIDKRRKGEVKSMLTPWPKLNRAFLEGIEWYTIFTIAGLSGSGKSTIANQLETGLLDLNPTENFVVLNFNLEMLSSKQVGRKISNKMNLTVQQLYSGVEGFNIDDSLYGDITKAAKSVDDYRIYYVDKSGSTKEIANTVSAFRREMMKKYGKDVGLVIILDHTLLTKGMPRDEERITIAKLYNLFVAFKKSFKCIVISLSQLNREIESEKRLTSPKLQYPIKRDIFGSEAAFQYSDYVLVSHKPAALNLTEYGPLKLPVRKIVSGDSVNCIYWHILKNREGEPKILRMIDNLKYNRVDEEEKEETEGQISFSVDD